MLVLIVSAAWLIHYPDIIKAPFRLTSVDAPKAVYTRTEGKLIRLFVHDNTTVRKGALLAYLESTADHDEVLQLANHLDSLSAWINTGRAGRLRHYYCPTTTIWENCSLPISRSILPMLNYSLFCRMVFTWPKNEFYSRSQRTWRVWKA